MKHHWVKRQLKKSDPYLSFPVIQQVITFLLHTRHNRIVTDNHSFHALKKKTKHNNDHNNTFQQH